MSGFTEDQKQKMRVLNKKYALKISGLFFKCFAILLLANFLVVFADIAYVHSKFFVFIVSFASGFGFSKLFLDNLRLMGDDLKAETIKIIQEKKEE